MFALLVHSNNIGEREDGLPTRRLNSPTLMSAALQKPVWNDAEPRPEIQKLWRKRTSNRPPYVCLGNFRMEVKSGTSTCLRSRAEANLAWIRTGMKPSPFHFNSWSCSAGIRCGAIKVQSSQALQPTMFTRIGVPPCVAKGNRYFDSCVAPARQQNLASFGWPIAGMGNAESNMQTECRPPCFGQVGWSARVDSPWAMAGPSRAWGIPIQTCEPNADPNVSDKLDGKPELIVLGPLLK